MTNSREKILLFIIIILMALCGQLYYSYHYLPQKTREVRVFYNRDIEANLAIIDTIQEANEYVYFAIYTFTRYDIKDALLGAKHRGLKVIGITDKEQILKIENQGEIVKELRASGIPIYTQDHSSIMHLKTLVTEKSFVSGSYNWTASATTSNDEVLEIGTDEQLRRQYESVLLKLFDIYGIE